MKKTYALLLLILYSITFFGQEIQFEQIHDPNRIVSAEFTKVSKSSSAFADIDGDKDMDVVICGITSNRLPITKLYLNDGNSNFTEIPDASLISAYSGSVIFADVDNDNDQDLFISGWNKEESAISILYFNDGKGNFTENTKSSIEGIYKSSCALADVDNDNDLDLLISGITGDRFTDKPTTKLYLNNGKGHFSISSTSEFTGLDNGAIAFADIDNDSDLDLLMTGNTRDHNNYSEPLTQLYMNNGKGVFTEAKEIPFPNFSYSDLKFGDIDSDGDQDVIISGYQRTTYMTINHTGLYINDGKGHFTEQYTSLPSAEQSIIELIDIDNDSDLDIIISGDLNEWEDKTKIYLNDGKGHFTWDKKNFPTVPGGSISLADTNGDNKLDILLTGCGMARLYHNDKENGFNYVNKPYLEGTEGGSVAFADIDGDNDQDALVTSGRIHYTNATIYKNNGKGFFSTEETLIEGVSSSSIAFADVDGDNDQDVMVSGWSANTKGFTKLYYNNGQGIFNVTTDMPFEQVAFSALAFADVDNDNDQDVVLTGHSYHNDKAEARLYINNGMGDFTEKQQSFTGVSQGYVAFADVDNDNDQDLIITGKHINNSVIISKLYTNDGTGNFSEVTNTPFKGVYDSSVAFADVDGDMDQDVLISGGDLSYKTSTKLYENKGNLNFEEVTQLPFDHVEEGTVAFADFDKDNKPDVLLSGRNNNDEYIAKLYKNNGKWNFSEIENAPLDGGAYGGMAIGDIDGDKDLDVFLSGRNKDGSKITNIYRNTTLITTTHVTTPTTPNTFQLYPNPTNSIINISLPTTSDDIKVKIFDLSGKLISQRNFARNKLVQLHLEGPNGLYFIEIVSQQSKQIFKVIKN